MWEPEPEELYTVGPASHVLGQPCAICRRPFAIGDVVTWRPWPPDPDVEGYEVSMIHLSCLRTAAQEAAQETSARPSED